MPRLHCQEDRYRCSDCCSSIRTQLGLQTLRELGQGGQGVVFLCLDQTRGVHLACKTIRSHVQPHSTTQKEQSIGGCCKKRKLHPTDADDDVHHQLSSSRRKLRAEEIYEDTQLRWEAEVLKHLSGIPSVLPRVSTFEGDDSCFHLVTAFCDAGDLLSKLDSHPPLFKLPSHEAAPIVASLARTLASCHARGIVHRDIKPGNILLRRVGGNDREEVVLADFGLAAAIRPGETLCDRVGTSRYQAPEVIRGQYDHRADIWSLGIIIHLLLTSTLPFIERLHHDAPDSAIQHAILCNELELGGFDLSPSAQDLLRRILCKDPSARLTLEEILCHPWLLHNTKLISVDSKKTKSTTSVASPTDSMTSSPSQHGVGQAVGGFDQADGVPKITRVCLPMGRKCFPQQWANAIAKAAIA